MRVRPELFVWDVHVNHDSDGHASDNKGERELFFVLVQQPLCHDCTRTDQSCVRHQPTSLLEEKGACSDGWLPAKMDGGVDKVVILKTFFSFSACFAFYLFCQHRWCQAHFCGVSRFLHYFPLAFILDQSINNCCWCCWWLCCYCCWQNVVHLF